MKKLLTILTSFSLLPLCAQNDCATALPVTAGNHVVAVIDGSQPSAPLCTGGDPATAAEWFIYSPDTDRSITVTTDLPVNMGRDTRFHVYQGTCGSLICVAGSDDEGSGYLSIASFNVNAGVSYYIVFDDRWEPDGFVFAINEGPWMVQAVSFTPQSLPVSGNIMCVVDMNGDHLDDVVRVSNVAITVLHQQADGTLLPTVYPTDTVTHMPSWSIAAGDLDGNGLNDLLYGGGQGTSFMYANDNGTGYTLVSGPEYVFSQRTNFIDIDNDGHLDAFVCHDVDPNVYYMNDGTGALTFYQGGLGDTPEGGNYGSIWVDHDNDGDQDLFIAKCRGGDTPAKINQLHRNNGDGTYTEVAAELGLADPIQTWSAAWGDYDNDGDMDIMVGVSSFSDGPHKLIRNDGDGVFTDVTAGSGFDLLLSSAGNENVTHDFDNDGYLDIFGAGGTMMMNNGDMTFSPTDVPMNNGPVGDLNNDGFLDVVRFATAYINDGNNNNWLKVNTVGTTSNVNGIGARITILTSMGTQIREVRSGDGFAFMSSLNAHFGLGQDDEVPQLVVRWPSGIVDSLSNVPANTTITIIEGSTGSTAIAEEEGVVPTIYPSPATDVLFIEPRAQGPVEVLDMHGRAVLNGTMHNGALDISGLGTGMYLLRFRLPNGQEVKSKFTKK